MSETFLVNGCPYCNYFKNPKSITTKLYYPRQDSINEDTEFVIMDCPYYDKPIVVYGEHVTSISKDQWGRILYRVRILFGTGTRLQLKRRYGKDHFYCYLEMSSIVKDKAQKLPDLKNR